MPLPSADSQPTRTRAAAADTDLCKQDLEQFDKLREALAHGVAQAVHQNHISMAEGVADPIDALFYACNGLEWEPRDVCHADRNHNPKRFPTMIAEYYMGGIVAGKTLSSDPQKHILHVKHAVLGLQRQAAWQCWLTSHITSMQGRRHGCQIKARSSFIPMIIYLPDGLAP